MLPVNARSEFVSRLSPGVVELVNFSDGRVDDTFRMFQIASPASHHPARSPTRGSGLGGTIDTMASVAPLSMVDGAVAQAAANDAAMARNSDDPRAAVH